MKKISPFLWFDTQAEEAANFYVSIFDNSRIVGVNHYREGAPMPAGTVLTVGFVLDGEELTALNGGPVFAFNPAISFVVNCDSQKEVDHLWQALSKGGEPGQCGWLTDKYGLSWQIVPTVLAQLLNSADAAASQRAFTAMMGMTKLDIAALQYAYDGD
jgi:predicted 3-demethylubiquinone-9 3-methyltransferase (glyoxalase superfamily)